MYFASGDINRGRGVEDGTMYHHGCLAYILRMLAWGAGTAER